MLCRMVKSPFYLLLSLWCLYTIRFPKFPKTKTSPVFSSPQTPKMASESNHVDASSKSHAHSPTFTTFGRPIRRRLSFRRRKPPAVRLGGKKPRKGFFLVRFFRRVKMRSLKLKPCCMLKKLKNYYGSLVKDMIKAVATIDSFQQRMLLEISFAVPMMGMGLSLSSFPNNYGSDHHR